MELDKNFKEFIKLLNGHKVKYLVVGGYAVNFHGYPRYTRDIDFWLWLSDTNLKNLINALEDFGFGSLNMNIEEFKNPENIIQLGYEPYRIDLLMDVDGVDFDECFKRKTTAELDETMINFLSLQDLITAKKAMGRLQDLADAEQLEKIKKMKKKD